MVIVNILRYVLYTRVIFLQERERKREDNPPKQSEKFTAEHSDIY